MKNSIAYLTKDKQADLNFLTNEILKRLLQTEFIILYGSYARNHYVRRVVRVEHGITTIKYGGRKAAFQASESCLCRRPATIRTLRVMKEDIDALIPKVELLQDITKRICEQRIKEYGEWKDSNETC